MAWQPKGAALKGEELSGPRMAKLTPSEVQTWLEWAGERLLALPVNGTKPSSYRSFWPDYPDDPNTAYGYTGEKFRIPAPPPDQIRLVDDILALIILEPSKHKRRVLQARSMISPLNGRHLYSWGRISKLLCTSRYIVTAWHNQGLSHIALNASPHDVYRFRQVVS